MTTYNKMCNYLELMQPKEEFTNDYIGIKEMKNDNFVLYLPDLNKIHKESNTIESKIHYSSTEAKPKTESGIKWYRTNKNFLSFLCGVKEIEHFNEDHNSLKKGYNEEIKLPINPKMGNIELNVSFESKEIKEPTLNDVLGYDDKEFSGNL